MFFGTVDEIGKIARRTGTAVFVMPDEVAVEIKNALVLAPEEKTTITIEQVREVLARLSVRQVTEQYIIIRPAELLGEEAANALLKSLEEPGEKVHFVLITDSPSRLLPTILSRAAVYLMREEVDFAGVKAEEKVKVLAKRLMVARGAELVAVAEEICKKKDGMRAYTLNVVGVAIEMLFKSYFMTGKEVFIKKLPKFLEAYEAISRNGHIKLHLVADLC